LGIFGRALRSLWWPPPRSPVQFFYKSFFFFLCPAKKSFQGIKGHILYPTRTFIISEQFAKPGIRFLATTVSQALALPASKIFALPKDDRRPLSAVSTNEPGSLTAKVAGSPIKINLLDQLLPVPFILNSHPISGFYFMLPVQLPHIKTVVIFYHAFLVPPFPASWAAHNSDFPKSIKN
jgi:hypothetical protein